MQPTPTHFNNKFGSGASQASGAVFAGGQTLQPQSTTYHQGWMQNATGGHVLQGHPLLSPNHQGAQVKAAHFSAQKSSIQHGLPADPNHPQTGQVSTVDMNSPQDMPDQPQVAALRLPNIS